MKVTLKPISTAGEDISILSNEIKIVLDDAFENIEKTVNGAGWVGESATAYLSCLKNDRLNYNEFKNALSNYSSYLNDYAYEMRSAVSRMSAPGVDMARSNNMGFNISLDNNGLNNIIYPSMDGTRKILNDAINLLNSSPYANNTTVNSYRNQISNIVGNLNGIENSIKDSAAGVINTEAKYEAQAAMLPSGKVELRRGRIL